MKQKTPMMTLIHKIELMQMADAVIEPLAIIKQLAIKLLPEEREGFEEAYWNGQKNIFGKKQDYFTQTYGGGDE